MKNSTVTITTLLIVIFLAISIFLVIGEVDKNTKLLQQQIEISQQINQKLKILTLKGK